MVTLDSAQHVNECTSWREELRSKKSEMTQLSEQLQKSASHQHNKDILTEVEHFQNQFYIQQINIHDLKQAIKLHERTLQLEMAAVPEATSSEETFHKHEELFSEYQGLMQTLKQLKEDFNNFLVKS